MNCYISNMKLYYIIAKQKAKKKDVENAHLNEIFHPTPVRVEDIDNIGQR